MIPAWTDIRPVLNTLRAGFPATEAQAVLDHPELQDALLADLAQLAEHPDELLDGGMLHIVGMLLLAEKRDPRLGPLLLKLTRFNDEEIEMLWGDFLTENWSQAVAAVCSADALKAFLENEGHSEWARAMACSALTIQVYEGDLDRQSTLDYAITLQEKYLQSLRNDPDNRSNDLMFDYLADIVGDLGEPSDIQHLDRWFSADILNPRHAGIAWYQSGLDKPFEERRAKARQRNEHYVSDAIRELSGLYCYSAEFHREKARSKIVTPKETAPLWPTRAGTFAREAPKIGRNDPCPCGSGKKYKKCCGA